MAASHAHPHAAAPPPPPVVAAQPTGPTAPAAAYAEQVRESMDLLRALLAQLDAAGCSANPSPGFFEPCRNRPGVRLEPVTWAELTAIVADGSEQVLGTLGRTPLQIREYWNYRDTVVLKRFASVTEYLLQKIFCLPTVPGSDGRLVAQVPPGFFLSSECNSSGNGNNDSRGGSGGSSSNGGSSSGGADSTGCSGSDGQSNHGHQLVTAWRDNDFPYNLEPGIAHFNLWANRPLSRQEVEQHLAQHVPPGAETLWFVNPPVLQSVPSIWHAHILVRQPAAGAAPQQQVLEQ